jgi:hypothetical protein
MSIAYRIFLAATLAAGLMVSGGAQAAAQEFSITLSDMTFENGSGLSAEAAAFGDQAARPPSNNGSYSETLTGDYAGHRHSAAFGRIAALANVHPNLAQRRSVFHR